MKIKYKLRRNIKVDINSVAFEIEFFILIKLLIFLIIKSYIYKYIICLI